MFKISCRGDDYTVEASHWSENGSFVVFYGPEGDGSNVQMLAVPAAEVLSITFEKAS
jgi:hypothetical protein